MRPIDADALEAHIDKLPALPDGNFAGTHSALKALIDMQPTIDAVPVVRCWECKYACKSSVLPLVICGHGKGLVDPRPDSFCSYGERKEDSNETD